MKNWTIDFAFADQSIPLSVQAPNAVQAIDDYRQVDFELLGRGKHRAVFFLLPDQNSDDPFATKPSSEWKNPVRWDDNTMLFIPTLEDRSIIAAMMYILEKGLEIDAFENEDDIATNDMNN